MNPLVSILVPAYNVGEVVRQTLLSALNQTWKKIEVIVVDDGSTDGTWSILKRFESPSCKVVRQDNLGAAAARNTAFSLAQGDYIQWLDSDDLIHPRKIEEQIDALSEDADPGILLFSMFRQFYYRPWKGRLRRNQLCYDQTPAEWMINKFQYNLWVPPMVWLVSRKLCETAGLWDERLTLDDDGEYFGRVVSCSKYVKYVPKAESFYRKWNPNSLSMDNSAEALRSQFLSLKLNLGYLLGLEDTARSRWAARHYLQSWFDYIYPDNIEFQNNLLRLSREIGGELSVPEKGERFGFLVNSIGRSNYCVIKNSIKRGRFFLEVNWDKFLAKMDGIWTTLL